MAIGRSTYPAGASTTTITGDPINQDPMAMLQALIGRESQTLARPKKSTRPAYSAGTGPRSSGPRMTMTGMDAAEALSSRSPYAGADSFVRWEPTHGRGLTGAGGFYGTTQGSPGAAWGGWRLPGQVTAPQNDAFLENKGGGGGGDSRGTDPHWKSEEERRRERLDAATTPGHGSLASKQALERKLALGGNK